MNGIGSGLGSFGSYKLLSPSSLEEADRARVTYCLKGSEDRDRNELFVLKMVCFFSSSPQSLAQRLENDS